MTDGIEKITKLEARTAKLENDMVALLELLAEHNMKVKYYCSNCEKKETENKVICCAKCKIYTCIECNDRLQESYCGGYCERKGLDVDNCRCGPCITYKYRKDKYCPDCIFKMKQK